MGIKNENYYKYKQLEMLLLDKTLNFKEMSAMLNITENTCKRWRERIWKQLKEDSNNQVSTLLAENKRLIIELEGLKADFVKQVNKIISSISK